MIINPAPENSSGVPPIPGVQPAPAPGGAPPEIVMAPIILAGEPGPPPIFGPQAPTQPASADVSAFATGQPSTESSISNAAETPASSPPPLSPEIAQAITYPPTESSTVTAQESTATAPANPLESIRPAIDSPAAPGQGSILPPPPAKTFAQMSPNLSPDVASPQNPTSTALEPAAAPAEAPIQPTQSEVSPNPEESQRIKKITADADEAVTLVHATKMTPEEQEKFVDQAAVSYGRRLAQEWGVPYDESLVEEKKAA